jgi:hypothetical protein
MKTTDCLGNFTIPAKGKTCGTCADVEQCKNKLRVRIFNLIKIRVRRRTAEARFDLYALPFNLTEAATNELNSLFARYAKDKGNFAGICCRCCSFRFPVESVTPFIAELKRIIGNPDNLKPIGGTP